MLLSRDCHSEQAANNCIYLFLLLLLSLMSCFCSLNDQFSLLWNCLLSINVHPDVLACHSAFLHRCRLGAVITSPASSKVKTQRPPIPTPFHLYSTFIPRLYWTVRRKHGGKNPALNSLCKRSFCVSAFCLFLLYSVVKSILTTFICDLRDSPSDKPDCHRTKGWNLALRSGFLLSACCLLTVTESITCSSAVILATQATRAEC